MRTHTHTHAQNQWQTTARTQARHSESGGEKLGLEGRFKWCHGRSNIGQEFMLRFRGRGSEGFVTSRSGFFTCDVTDAQTRALTYSFEQQQSKQSVFFELTTATEQQYSVRAWIATLRPLSFTNQLSFWAVVMLSAEKESVFFSLFFFFSFLNKNFSEFWW